MDFTEGILKHPERSQYLSKLRSRVEDATALIRINEGEYQNKQVIVYALQLFLYYVLLIAGLTFLRGLRVIGPGFYATSVVLLLFIYFGVLYYNLRWKRALSRGDILSGLLPTWERRSQCPAQCVPKHM